MLGTFDGTPREKLGKVSDLFADLAPQASCRLSRDGREIICQAVRPDSVLHAERLPTEHLAAGVVRHAAMRLGKATHPPESIGEWERWASAWHMIQNYGTDAIARTDQQIAMLKADGALSGAAVYEDLRRRVAVLQAKPDAWAGRA